MYIDYFIYPSSQEGKRRLDSPPSLLFYYDAKTYQYIHPDIHLQDMPYLHEKSPDRYTNPADMWYFLSHTSRIQKYHYLGYAEVLVEVTSPCAAAATTARRRRWATPTPCPTTLALLHMHYSYDVKSPPLLHIQGRKKAVTTGLLFFC